MNEATEMHNAITRYLNSLTPSPTVATYLLR